MNKEQMTQEQRAQLIEKLRAEYKDLNGKIARLNAFLCDIDFVKKVPDPIEQSLMSMQLRSMKGYLDNLRARIMFQEGQQLREENDRKQIDEWKKMKGHIIPVNLDEHHHCGQDTRRRDEAANRLCELLVKGRMIVFAPGKKCDKCGGNMFEGFGEEEGGKILCFNCANQITNEELQQALDEYRSACLHHCGQDASCQVSDGSAAVDKPVITGESLKQLMDYHVIGVCEPGFPCEGCVQDHYNTPCVKVELVGGTYLCLAPRPNSIITE